MSQQSSECLRLITEPFEANNAAAAVENAVDTGYIPGGVQIDTNEEIEAMNERYRRFLEWSKGKKGANAHSC
jgi:hypothetical protein